MKNVLDLHYYGIKMKEGYRMVSLDKDFETVSLEDIPMIESYLARCNYEESNHNIVNMILWMDVYPLWKCVNEHYLLLLGIHNRKLFLYMPLCEEAYFKDAILCAKMIFDRYQCPFRLSCFTKHQIELAAEVVLGYQICAVRNSFDYVYECEKLRTFGGKKLQKKRNHLNAFYKTYEDRFTYEVMTAVNAKECIPFLTAWKDEEDDLFLKQEKEGTQRILALWDQLPARGGIIRVDGEIKAFAIGSRLSDTMCQMNIEKADDSIRGIYQAIVKEFLSREFLDATYVNREDDMGKENIRKAKEAYHPAFMVEKYQFCECGEINDYIS